MPQEQPKTMTILEFASQAMRLLGERGSNVPVRGVAGECVVSLVFDEYLGEIVVETADPIVFERDEEGE